MRQENEYIEQLIKRIAKAEEHITRHEASLRAQYGKSKFVLASDNSSVPFTTRDKVSVFSQPAILILGTLDEIVQRYHKIEQERKAA